MKHRLKTLGIFILFGLFSILLMAMTLDGSMTSAEVEAEGRAPIRPTPQPTSVPGPAAKSQVTGGLIVLQASADTAIEAGLWTRVEWQDPHTNLWHQVDGWQGEFDANKQVTWFVARQNLNEQLFRWVVYSDETLAKRLATSDLFDLPTTAKQTITVDISW